jgi:hypothetical protein
MKAALIGVLVAVAVTVGTPASAGPFQEGTFTLKVSVSGDGKVTSSPSGISCPSKCSATFSARTTVGLSANPGSGSTFGGWGGDCSGTGGCKVVMSQNRSVSATFRGGTPPGGTQITLTVTVAGTGSVSSNPAGIACPGDCTENYSQGTSVTLAPFPGAGSNFVSWSGACSGAGLCTVAMTASKSVKATFSTRKAPPPETAPLPGSDTIVNGAPIGRPFHLTLKFICYSANELFLAKLYEDVLKRPVDPAAINVFVPQLNSGTPPAKVALAVLQSVEYRTMLLQGFYSMFLHRPGSPGEIAAGLGMLGGGASDEDVEAALLGSSEYFGNRAGGTNDGFLQALFMDVLGRTPDAGERALFGGALTNRTPRAQVAAQILGSTEARTKLIQRLFQAFLGRAPTPAELNSFLGMLGSGGSDEGVAAAILGSAEYIAKAGQYHGQVHWGDRASSAGKIAHAGKRCTLTGDHTYKRGGEALVKVDILAPDDRKTTLSRHVNVGGGGSSGGGGGPGTPPPSGKENVVPSGTVLIKVHGTFVPLTGFKQVPFGTELDTTNGKVKLTSHDGSTGSFYEGRFKLLQALDTPVPGKPSIRVTELVLTGGDVKACSARATAGTAKPKHKTVRHAWGNAKGHFRTTGSYASATVRGTLWKTEDFCDGTLVIVKRGKIDVFDKIRRKHVLVPAGRSYFAKS